jgi:ABC-2 type transport system permease protein
LLLTMALAVVIMFIVALGLTGLGMCIAWPMDSTAGFHAVMMVFLMPMWFLSGAVFPISTAPTWLAVIMWLNPLTHGHIVLSSVLNADYHDPRLPLAAGVTVVFTIAIVLLATRMVAKPRKDGLA